MAYLVDPILGTDLTTTASSTTGKTPVFVLGTTKNGSGGAMYMAVQAHSAITQYQFVKIDDDYGIHPLTSTLSGSEPTKIGCAQIAFTAKDYGWVVVQGAFSGLTSASCSADVVTYTSATAGAVRTVSSTGHDQIYGLKLTAAAAGATTGTFYAAIPMATNS